MVNDYQELILSIAKVGKENPSYPELHKITPFQLYFSPDGQLDHAHLDNIDGSSTRRELLLRFLILNAVLDQGPDIIGVRKLLQDVSNDLYNKGISFIHSPLLFFQEICTVVDLILSAHERIKQERAEVWATENQSSPNKYNLFMDNSKQVLNYAIFRWGVPLSLPLLLLGGERNDCSNIIQSIDKINSKGSAEEIGRQLNLPIEISTPNDSEYSESSSLGDYLESWVSAEEMSQQLKDHQRFGLGKAIGDKACHLFAKWMVSSFRLARRRDKSWGDLSYEVPFDSNAGRVLWRTGYLLNWATEDDYIKRDVVQPGKGKSGTAYIRVTNIRGMKVTTAIPSHLFSEYVDLSVNYLKTHKRSPKKVEIQRIQHVYLKNNYQKMKLGVADFDEGSIYIGTSFCFNHSDPLCDKCPINHLCEGYQSNPSLIDDYRT